MVNSNNICTRFINYFSFLILLCFSSLSFAYTGSGGQFGGGGASGDWGPSCDASTNYLYFRNPFVPKSGGSHNPTTICNLVAANRGQIFEYLLDESGGNVMCYMKTPTGGRDQWSLDSELTPCETCPIGQERDPVTKQCKTKKCPIGQSLVNGQCKPKQCPIGQTLDSSGNCMPADDQCPSGQKKVNGRCITPPPDEPEPEPDPNDPNFKLPPFCEWASVMCQWHEEWVQWSNDYAANEEKANLDREELKRIGLDSKEYLDEINQKMTEHKIKLDEIKNQDQQFYDELRLWLNNFDSTNGNPSEQNPSIEFPPFCDWSVQVCNWYLDWKDWREDYNAHNEAVLQKFNDHLEKLNEIKNQDKQYYDQDLQQNNDFYEDVRDFFDWYKGQSSQNPNVPTDPPDPEQEDGNVAVNQEQIPFDESQRITFVNACPPDQQFTINFMGRSQTLGFSYQPLCQFMTMIRPFVIAIAYLIGAYILMGLSRGSSE